MPTPSADDTPPVPDGTEAAAAATPGAVPLGVGGPLPWWARNSPHPYLTHRQVRRHTPRGIAATLALTTVLLLGIGWILLATGVKEVTPGPLPHSRAYKQTTNALIGGCGPMYQFSHTRERSGTVPATDATGQPNRQTYPTTVPAYGAFWDAPAPTGRDYWPRTAAHPPVAENLLDNMWHGAMVVYYTRAVSDHDLRLLRDILALHPELDLIAVPWEETARLPLPDHRQIAFVTWNNSQTCHQLIAPALYDFRTRHPATDAPGYPNRPAPVLPARR